MKKIKALFWWGAFVVTLLIGGLLLLYFTNFHGPLATDSSKWAEFSSFIGNISMLFLTALNIVIIYKLTYIVAEREENQHVFELKRELNNSFTRSLYSVFVKIDEDNLTCDLAANQVTLALDNFRLLQTFKEINPIFGSPEYDKFINDYIELVKEYLNGETMSNTTVDQKAYNVLASARRIRLELYKELTKNNNQ